MGATLQPPLPLHFKFMVQEKKGICKSYSGPLWSKVFAAQSKIRRQERKQRMKRLNGGHVWSKKPKRILMKRRALLEGSRRPMNGMERKIRILKKLVPNGKKFMSLDGLFKETADYILCLQMQLKVMQIMFKDLSGSNE